MLDEVIAESDSLETKVETDVTWGDVSRAILWQMRYDMIYQEELMLAKLQAGGGRRKAGRMLQDALKQHNQKHERIKQHLEAQNDGLRTIVSLNNKSIFCT